MATRRYHIGPVVLFALAVLGQLTGAAALAQEPPSRTIAPKLQPNSISVVSIPTGLKVYFGPDTEKTASGQKGGTPLIAKHPLIADGYLKGVTPILIRNVQPGKYLLGIAPITIISREHGFGTADKTMEVRAYVSVTPLPPPIPLKEDLKGAAIYSINKETPNPLRVIVLATPPDASLELLDSLYPAEAKFQFDKSAYTKDMKERTKTLFSEDETAKVIGLLQRGGKVMITKGDIQFVSEIKTDGAWTIDMYILNKAG